MGFIDNLNWFVTSDLENVCSVYAECRDHLLGNSFCNTHCRYMIKAIAEEEKDDESYAVDKCIETHCDDCPLSAIICMVDAIKTEHSPMLDKILEEDTADQENENASNSEV